MNASLIGWPKEEELGEYMYIYTGGDPLVRKEYLITQTSHTKNYNVPRLFLMFRGIEYDFWLLRV